MGYPPQKDTVFPRRVESQSAIRGDDVCGKADKGVGGQKTTCEIEILKTSPEENLGVDLRHVQGTLEVMQVFSGGAIWRTNKDSRSNHPQGQSLEVGDCILRVNDVDWSARQMIDELRLSDTIRL